MHVFLSNLANRQTDRQTRAKTCTSSFLGGNNVTLSARFHVPVRCDVLTQLEKSQLLFYAATGYYVIAMSHGPQVPYQHGLVRRVGEFITHMLRRRHHMTARCLKLFVTV